MWVYYNIPFTFICLRISVQIIWKFLVKIMREEVNIIFINKIKNCYDFLNNRLGEIILQMWQTKS